jgi:hypothetical protein
MSGERGTGPDWECYVCLWMNCDLRTRCRNCFNVRFDDPGGEVHVFDVACLEVVADEGEGSR